MDYTIIRVTEEPTFNDGNPGSDMRVEFKVGASGPFYERFRKADFTRFAVEQRLGDFARELKLLMPHL